MAEARAELALFQPSATAQDFLTAEQMDWLIAEHAPRVNEGQLSHGGNDASLRRSQIAFLPPEQKYAWLYNRLWAALELCNKQFFDVELAGVEPNLQVGRYDSSNSGFYDWHTDLGPSSPRRKLSVSVQLSSSADYDGGDLELMYGPVPTKQDRGRGSIIIFPSFMLHRVTPVTRGTRWSLVAWVLGRRWR
jgi:PKHD-type hydroxylase